MANFDLSEKEREIANSFIEKHKQCRPKHNDPLQQYAPFAYTFEPNGIGMAVTITCPYCGDIEDITDIDSW